MANDQTSDKQQWYVLLLASGKERRYSQSDSIELLQAAGITCFYPTEERSRVRAGKTVRYKAPLIPGTLFAYGTRGSLLRFVDDPDNCLRFRFDRARYREPMTVPSAQMENFMRAVESSAQRRYMAQIELATLKLGDRVRVVGGSLDGVCGKVVVKRGRPSTKTVLVRLEGLLSASFEVEAGRVEKIEKAEEE